MICYCCEKLKNNDVPNICIIFLTLTGVTNERYINLNGKQVEIKKAEPRDGGGGYNKMGDSSQWGGHHQGQPMGMVQGPNGQMGGPPMNMHAPNMMPSYQNWGTSPQQQGYGYGGSSAPNSYQGWGGPPQGVPQWNNYGNQPPTQGYGGYDMYNSTTAPNASTGANWSSWNMPSNNGGSATGSGPDMYNRSQTWTGNQSAGAPGMPRAGPGNSASKSGSEYEYSGYGSGYDYDYTNYGKEPASGTFNVPRSYGETAAPPQYPPSQAV